MHKKQADIIQLVERLPPSGQSRSLQRTLTGQSPKLADYGLNAARGVHRDASPEATRLPHILSGPPCRKSAERARSYLRQGTQSRPKLQASRT